MFPQPILDPVLSHRGGGEDIGVGQDLSPSCVEFTLISKRSSVNELRYSDGNSLRLCSWKKRERDVRYFFLKN